jgi:hypothetical protein
LQQALNIAIWKEPDGEALYAMYGAEMTIQQVKNLVLCGTDRKLVFAGRSNESAMDKLYESSARQYHYW